MIKNLQGKIDNYPGNRSRLFSELHSENKIIEKLSLPDVRNSKSMYKVKGRQKHFPSKLIKSKIFLEDDNLHDHVFEFKVPIHHKLLEFGFINNPFVLHSFWNEQKVLYANVVSMKQKLLPYKMRIKLKIDSNKGSVQPSRPRFNDQIWCFTEKSEDSM